MGTKMQESKVRDVEFEKKAMSAAMRFLALRGYELIDEEWAHEQDVPVIVAKKMIASSLLKWLHVRVKKKACNKKRQMMACELVLKSLPWTFCPCTIMSKSL